jgi:parvulin-like peptidyl-prolyl isomerase
VDGIRQQLLMREVIGREVGRTIIVSREDARKYFEQHKDQFAHPPGVHLAEILISKEKHPQDASQRADAALAEIKAGQPWGDMVKKYSDDPAEQGGDIGFMEEGTLAPDIAQVIANVDTGETTGVIPTKLGFLILKVLERRSAGPAKFEEVDQQVEEFLYDQKMGPALRKYLLELRKQSYIVIASGYIDTGVEPYTETGPTKTGQ